MYYTLHTVSNHMVMKKEKVWSVGSAVEISAFFRCEAGKAKKKTKNKKREVFDESGADASMSKKNVYGHKGYVHTADKRGPHPTFCPYLTFLHPSIHPSIPGTVSWDQTKSVNNTCSDCI